MNADKCWKTVKKTYRVSSKYRMQLEFNFPEYLIGKCRFSADHTQAIKTQKISITREGIIFSDTLPLSWFTSALLIPWAKLTEMTISDELPSIDGALCTPWSSNLQKQTVDFQYCTIHLTDPVKITVDLPWSRDFTDTVQTRKLFDI